MAALHQPRFLAMNDPYLAPGQIVNGRAAAHQAPAINGWHPGQIVVQELRGNWASEAAGLSSIVQPYLPEQHRQFYSYNLHFLPVTTLDSEGRPWSSILTGKSGRTGFVSSPDSSRLVVNAHVWDGDPIKENLSEGSWRERAGEDVLVSGVGVEMSTRRRNKFSGNVRTLKWSEDGNAVKFDFIVTQTIGYVLLSSIRVASQCSPSWF